MLRTQSDVSWYVVLGEEGRFVTTGLLASDWLPDNTYCLHGNYAAQKDAQALVDAANLLLGDDPTGTRLAALRLIVEDIA